MGSGYYRNFGAADQVRTGPKSLEGSCATTTPQPLILKPPSDSAGSVLPGTGWVFTSRLLGLALTDIISLSGLEDSGSAKWRRVGGKKMPEE